MPAILPDSWEFQNAKVVLLPYSDKHPDVFPETFWATIFHRFRDENTLDIIFPGMGIRTMDQFICYMGDRRRLGRLVCCLRNPSGPPKPVGIGWLCEYEQGRASFGFGYFKEMWGNRLHIDLSMFQLAYWFKEMKCQVLYGTTINPLALRYSKRFGFEYLCRLPKFFPCQGELKDASLIVLERLKFLQYYREWWTKC